MEEYKQEGFWYSKSEPHYPMPVEQENQHPLKDLIIEKYDALLSLPVFHPDYNSGEPLDWDEIHNHVVSYRGFSWCRICPSRSGASMGTKSYRYNGWEWPEGFRHYIVEHNVVPSKEFLKEVLGMEV
jgi:hypothetical protein